LWPVASTAALCSLPAKKRKVVSVRSTPSSRSMNLRSMPTG
jgi:hypothetical protein